MDETSKTRLITVNPPSLGNVKGGDFANFWIRQLNQILLFLTLHLKWNCLLSMLLESCLSLLWTPASLIEPNLYIQVGFLQSSNPISLLQLSTHFLFLTSLPDPAFSRTETCLNTLSCLTNDIIQVSAFGYLNTLKG